ncbi:MAG: CBS domain-containing protein [Anaerolineae bacterium]|nr:CBS domain-containing protein [Anaerolineae bacterium]MCO5189635.1 CBS domain-containing protein [Anaerolineae bacterium]MCO5196722.1 CBS domain-containing protein [Anaerolineae bacterium]MCO5206826.1 CBS domain-containing protein [Anaerolineae bacterium]
MSAQTVMQAKRYGVYTCQAGDTLLRAATRMVDEFISALVVVDDSGSLVGVISRVDLLRARLDSAEWKTSTVGDYMSTNVTTIAPDAPLLDAARLLVDQRIHRLVVTTQEDGSNRPIAVISTADLVYHMTRANMRSSKGGLLTDR